MVGRNFLLSLLPCAPAVGALLTLGLGGCAGIGDTAASVAFADPSKYDLFDCKRLEGERKNLANRTAELNGLMEKARTGTGGTVVAELAYRNDYVSTRASARLADDAWAHNKCATGGAAPAAAAAPDPRAPKSGSAVY